MPATARVAPPALPRASPPRRPAPSSFRAKRRAGSSCPRISPSRSDNYGAPQVVAAPNAAAAMGRHRIGRIALSLTHDRVSASAVALAEPAVTAAPLAGRILLPLLSAAARRDPREPEARLRRRRPGRGDHASRAGALRAPVAAVRGIPQVPLALTRAQGGAGARREHRGPRRRGRDGQGRARPDRPLRQLGGGDDRRHRQLSGSSRPLPFRPPRDQAAVARRTRHPPLQQGRLRRAAEARLARRDSRNARAPAT